MSSQPKHSAKADANHVNDPKQRIKVQQLQELFPTWSNDGTHAPSSLSFPPCVSPTRDPCVPTDLLSLLNEVHGDLELAATRITEGDFHRIV
jgi:hypothetical protein